jgi:1-acyl-sn-glycerol-3-phosphate acyltransferase
VAFSLVTKPWQVIIPVVLLPLCFLSLVVVHLLFCGVVSLFANRKKEVETPNRFVLALLEESIVLVLFILRYKVTESGKDLLPRNRRFLLVSNHLSGFDPITTIPSVKGLGVRFVSKPENFKIPIAGGLMHLCGFMPIDRDSPRNSMRTLHKCVDMIKNDRASVCIYPEGHRSETGELLEFKDGVFYVAKKAECPVVVMTVKYERRALWGKKVALSYKAIIEPETFKEKNTHALSEEVREIMLEN